jgi:small subunit ribosomal protein S20
VAHSLSSKKRTRQNTRKRTVNRARKSSVKTEIKRFENALRGSEVEKAQHQFRLTARQLDRTASKSALHRNTAARKKAQLAKRLNSLIAKKASG